VGGIFEGYAVKLASIERSLSPIVFPSKAYCLVVGSKFLKDDEDGSDGASKANLYQLTSCPEPVA
jgi:hypothetical protein